VVTISRLLKIIGLFCRISSLLQGSFAKEPCDLKEPTSRSHPICIHRESMNVLMGVVCYHVLQRSMLVRDNIGVLMGVDGSLALSHAHTHR